MSCKNCKAKAIEIEQLQGVISELEDLTFPNDRCVSRDWQESAAHAILGVLIVLLMGLTCLSLIKYLLS